MEFGLMIGNGLTAYEPDAAVVAYRDAIATVLSAKQEALLNTMVKAIKACGAWDKLDAMYLLANHEASGELTEDSAALVNIIDPTKYHGTISGTILSENLIGCKVGTASSYIDTGINLTDDPAPKIGKETATLMVDIARTVAETSKSEISGYVTNGILFRAIGQATKLAMKCNTGSVMQPIFTHETGCLGLIKRAANKLVYTPEAGDETETASLGDTNVEDVNLKIFGSGSTDTSTKTLGMVVIGGQLSAAEYNALEAAWVAYREALRISDIYEPMSKSIERIQWQYNDDTHVCTDYEISIHTLIPGHAAPDSTGLTGLGNNLSSKKLVAAYYKQNIASKLWLFRKNALPAYPTEVPVPESEIDLTSLIDYIQGVDHDTLTGYYWVIGTLKGEESANTNRTLICVDASGALIVEHPLTTLSIEPGMIVVLGDLIYIKPNAATNVIALNKNTFVLVKTLPISGTQEGLAVDKVNRKIWLGVGATFQRYDLMGTLEASFDSTILGDEIEGLVIDPADDTVWAAADCWLHGDVPDGNAVWHYDFNESYKKFVRIPEMIRWDECTLGAGLSVVKNRLRGSGELLTPIFDFGDYKDFLSNLPVITADGKTVTIRYRGSSTAPSTTAQTEMACEYYPGWGTTAPSGWAALPPEARYI